MKYIFVTGGVVSGLGKGMIAASLGRILKECGFKVSLQKLDPYINIDPGTMSPYQHGEVFVTEDGAETDLDLGHYERFINENLNKYSNLTSGKVYWNVLNKERKGDYLGQTVQIIPHITNEIKTYIHNACLKSEADIIITEIGGTVGDMESQPFFEAIRQIRLENNRNDTLFVHVSLIPLISGSDEYKSKPTQHSVKTLQELGISPDIIVGRCDGKLPDNIKNKISLFCNVKKECVIESPTVSNLYELPLELEKQNISGVVLDLLGLPIVKPDLSSWEKMVYRYDHPKYDCTVAMVGKYVELHDAYLSVVEALRHGAYGNEGHVHIKWIEAEDITEENVSTYLNDVDGIVVPGGFGNRGIEGMILAAKYARENMVPYLGLCLGMQIATIEFGRNVLGYKDANSNEFDESSNHKIIDYLPGQNQDIAMGGTLRLGAYKCSIKEGSKLKDIYQKDLIEERHRHRYEFQNKYREEFEKNGMIISGSSPDNYYVEVIELKEHPFYVGVQYHPEFKSRPNKPHPLFREFIKAALDKKDKR